MTLLFEMRRLARQPWIAMATLGLLAACGGGTSQVEVFVPGRLIVLGDDHSVIVDDGAANGRKYTVNGLDAAAARDCLLLPIWVQSLATHYGFSFAECNKAGAVPKAFMRAKVGAKVEDATAGIDAQLAEQASAGGAVGPGDLVTVMMGANDLVDLAQQSQTGALGGNEAKAEARRRGVYLAQRINALLAGGVRAIVSTTPDIGLSPLAFAMERQTAGAAQLLKDLSLEFNAALRTGIDGARFDGRNYGLVLADDQVQLMARLPSAFNLNNVVDAVCVKALPDCTAAATDLVAGATVAGYLWAGAFHPSPAVHAQIGSQAVSRARNNPF